MAGPMTESPGMMGHVRGELLNICPWSLTPWADVPILSKLEVIRSTSPYGVVFSFNAQGEIDVESKGVLPGKN